MLAIESQHVLVLADEVIVEDDSLMPLLFLLWLTQR